MTEANEITLRKLAPWAESAYTMEGFNKPWHRCEVCNEPEYQYPEPDLSMWEGSDGTMYCERCRPK